MSELAELRKIIIGEQADQLESIKERLEQFTLRSNDVAEILPEAISQANDQRGIDIGTALSATIKTSIEKDRQGFADIFYPVLAPSIRLMVASMIRSFSESMNQTLESATSLQGLKWRFESMRTGVPYPELAIRRSLEYRVEQVFLIQPETGLLIEHVLNEDVQGIDSDAVSGMLTAIQNFVTDSFDAKSGEHLTNLQVGELKVWMVHGPQALIACVIRGDAPNALRGQIIDILDQIHIKYATELSEFDGETNIAIFHDEIEPCLQLKLKDYEIGQSKTSRMALLLFLALLLGIVYWLWSGFDKNRIRNESSSLLAQTPGVLATDIFWNDDKLNIVGLMDPIAELPWEELTAIGLEPEQARLEMKKFRSLEPTILSKRIRNRYEFPQALKIDLDQVGDITVAQLSGELSYGEYRNIITKTTGITGADVKFDTTKMTYQDNTFTEYINKVINIPQTISLHDKNGAMQVSGLPELEWLESLQKVLAKEGHIAAIYANDLENKLQQTIHNDSIVFERGAVTLGIEEEKKLAIIADKMNELSLALSLHQKVATISIIPSINSGKKLRALRAEAVRASLIDNNVDPKILKITEKSDFLNGALRGVNFRIIL